MSVAKGSPAPAFAATEAFFLSGVAGCIDAIGVLTLGGLFVAHMSGNSAAFGAAFGQGDWWTGLPHLFAVPLFLVGLFGGYLWILRTPSYRRCASILLIEALLLAVFAILFARSGSPERNTLAYFGFAALPLLLGCRTPPCEKLAARRSQAPTSRACSTLSRSRPHWLSSTGKKGDPTAPQRAAPPSSGCAISWARYRAAPDSLSSEPASCSFRWRYWS